MTKHIGVDFGSCWLKAVIWDGTQTEPQTLQLDEESNFSFLPAVACPKQGLGASRELYNRRRVDCSIFWGCRDRVAQSSEIIAGGDQIITGREYFSSVLTGLGQRIQKLVTGKWTLAVSVPDDWSFDQWPLAVALSDVGVRPTALVRESSAVLAHSFGLRRRPVIMISAGSGGTRASLCMPSSNGWRRVDTETVLEASGMQLRLDLVRHLASEIVTQVGQDPREIPASDQSLHNAAEKVLEAFQTAGRMNLSLEIMGRPVEITAHSEWVRESSLAMQSSIDGMINRLLTRGKLGPRECQAVVWGDLVQWLPLEQWLRNLDIRSVVTAPLEIVAQGVAQIEGLLAQEELKPTDSNSSWVDYKSGQFAPQLRDRDAGIVVIESIEDYSFEKIGLARLVWMTDQAHTEAKPIGTVFRLGRDHRSEWVVPEDKYPDVSRAHAIIRCENSRFLLSDLGSTNGTYVNGKIITKVVELKPGDVLSLGVDGPTFRFER